MRARVASLAAVDANFGPSVAGGGLDGRVR